MGITREQKSELSTALRAEGLVGKVAVTAGSTPEAWKQACSLVEQGLNPKQVARLVRSTLPEAVQREIAQGQADVLVRKTAKVVQAAQPKKLAGAALAAKEGRVLRRNGAIVKVLTPAEAEAYRELSAING